MAHDEGYLPDVYIRFVEQHREVADALWKVAEAEHAAGPLDERSRRLVKLGIAIGSESQGAVRSHARRALDAGMTAEELRHAALLALTTVGFPRTVAALGWIEDVASAP